MGQETYRNLPIRVYSIHFSSGDVSKSCGLNAHLSETVGFISQTKFIFESQNSSPSGLLQKAYVLMPPKHLKCSISKAGHLTDCALAHFIHFGAYANTCYRYLRTRPLVASIWGHGLYKNA